MYYWLSGMALSCKETFSLLYYEFDAANKEPPPWEPESYKLIDRIAADEGRFTSNSEVQYIYIKSKTLKNCLSSQHFTHFFTQSKQTKL